MEMKIDTILTDRFSHTSVDQGIALNKKWGGTGRNKI